MGYLRATAATLVSIRGIYVTVGPKPQCFKNSPKITNHKRRCPEMSGDSSQIYTTAGTKSFLQCPLMSHLRYTRPPEPNNPSYVPQCPISPLPDHWSQAIPTLSLNVPSQIQKCTRDCLPMHCTRNIWKLPMSHPIYFGHCTFQGGYRSQQSIWLFGERHSNGNLMFPDRGFLFVPEATCL